MQRHDLVGVHAGGGAIRIHVGLDPLLDLAHAGLDLRPLRRILGQDLEVVVEPGAIGADGQRASFHHRQSGQRGRELNERFVRSPGHGVVSGAGGLPQQHRDHRHRVGRVGVQEIAPVPEQAVLLRLEADVEAADVLQPEDRDPTATFKNNPSYAFSKSVQELIQRCRTRIYK